MLWPATSWAQEYVATVYSDATFTDEIGSYTSLDEALTNATDNQGVKLLTDITESVTFSKSNTIITLDLNDKIITAPYSSRVIEISGGTLIIVDRATVKTTRYWTEDDHDYYWMSPTTGGSGSLTTSGGCITGGDSSEAGGIKVNRGASLSLNGGNVVGNRGGSSGGGIYVNEGTCTISANARVCGNSASSGGGIYFKNGTLNIYGGSIDNNMATHGGGGVYYYNGTLNLSGAPKIIDNLNTYTSYYPDYTIISEPNNLYFDPNNIATLSADPGYLSDGASIGVTKEPLYYGYSICFTNELDEETAISQMAYFFSDDPNYCISYDYNSYDNTAVLCLATAVATLKNSNGTVTKGSYAKVTDALAAAEDGDQVILIDNVEEDVVFSKPGGTTVTLDLNDKNISHSNYSSSYGSRVITISKTGDAEGNATLTIVDNAEGKTPLYWAEHSYWKDWSSSNTSATGQYAATRVTYGGCIKGGSSGGIIVNSGAVLNLNGGNVVGNTDTQGGGIYVNGGTCIIGSGAKVCGNTATHYDGGGIYVNGGTLTINGGSIECNHINDDYNRNGGGVYLASGSLNLSGATKITGNALRGNGATNNLYLANGRTATISSVLTAGASIGITMQTPGTFTTGLTAGNVDAQMAYFSSDNLFYYVTKDNNQLKLTHYPAVLYTNASFATPVRGYATLTSAFNAAGNGEGVKLFADITEYVTFQKTGGTTVTLDLNDKVIKSSSDQKVIAMSKKGATEGNVTLNIVDNANTKTTRYWEFSGSNKYWTIKEDQEAANNTDNPYSTLGGCITGGDGGIQVLSSCVLNLNGGNVVGNNKSSSSGGGIYVVGTCTIGSGAKVCGNYAGDQGGGVAIINYNDVAGTLYNNGSIIYNYANNDGGGVYVNTNCTFTNTGQINNNTARNDGGGVYFDGATLNLSGASIISGNTKSGSLSTPNNIYLPTGKLVTITDDITGSNIGVTMQTPGVFTSGLDSNGDASIFTSDDTSKDVGLNAGGEAIIGTPYAITSSATNGEISTTPATTAVNGALVVVTATPNEGSTLNCLTYTPAGGAATDIITTKQFEMPAANVAISAVFLYELTSENVSVPNATYSGASQTAVVKYGETVLEKGTDYTVAGTDSQTDHGTTESFTITGKGDYTGSVAKTFTIAAADLSTTAIVSGSSKTVDYDGETSPAIDDLTVNFPEADYTIEYRKTYQEGADVTTIPTNVIGEYTVVLKPTDTGNLTGEMVTEYTVNVQLPVSLKQCEWTTYFDERFDLATPADYQVYKVSAASASGVTAEAIGYIPQGVPVILKTTASGTSSNSMTVRFNESQSTPAITGNDAFIGVPSTSAGVTPAGTNFILVGDKFVLYEGTDAIPAHRCYLTLGGAGTRSIGIDFGDGETTSISDPPNPIFEELGQWYDLQGRRIEKPTKKGLFIKDGQKVVITGKEGKL